MKNTHLTGTGGLTPSLELILGLFFRRQQHTNAAKTWELRVKASGAGAERTGIHLRRSRI